MLSAFEIEPSQPTAATISDASNSSSSHSISRRSSQPLQQRQPLKRSLSDHRRHGDNDADGISILDPHHEMMELGDGGGGHAAATGGDLTSAVLGIIKAMVGPAILYLPHGFAAAGYMVALPIMAISTCLYLHSSSCLLECWKYESEKQLLSQQDDDDDDDDDDNIILGEDGEPLQPQQNEQILLKRKNLSYPELAYRAFGSYGEQMVKVGIAMMQSGVCLTYTIFVPHNLHTSLSILFGWDNLGPNFYLVLMVLVQIPLSWIRDIRKFTFTNALANALILYGLTLCLWFALSQAMTTPATASSSHDDSTTNHTKNDTINNSTSNNSTTAFAPRMTVPGGGEGPLNNVWDHIIHLNPFGDHWILFIGTSVLLFEGSITLLIPLQEAVQPNSNNDRAKFGGVYRQVIIGIQIFYLIFGTTCWMSFGDSVNTVLTTSLPAGFMATTVQLAYSIAVLFTFPLQNFPALEITCHSIQRAISDNQDSSSTSNTCGKLLPPPVLKWVVQRNVISSLMVCLLAIVALTTMDALDKVVSLMGSLVGCPVAFIIPPLIHTKLLKSQLTTRQLAQNRVVAVLGGFAMVLASITTIIQWRD